MIHLRKSLVLALALIGVSPLAQAAIYSDIDLAGPAYAYLNHNGWRDGGETGTDRYTGTFNILKDGYNPQTEVICKAAFWFAFADDSRDGCGQEEIVRIRLEDETKFYGDVDGSIWHYDWVWGAIGGSLLATLSDTGVLDYTVRIVSGDAYLKEAGLIAESCRRQVPDGGSTIALFGVGILGLALLRRRVA